MAMGHNKAAEKWEYTCDCGKVLDQKSVVMSGRNWRSQKLNSYWICSCGKKVRVKRSGHKVS